MENLEWMTSQENSSHAFKTGLCNNDCLKKEVLMLSLDNKVLKRFDSVIEASMETGTNRTSISSCCNNKKYYNTAGGFKWQFLNKIK